MTPEAGAKPGRLDRTFGVDGRAVATLDFGEPRFWYAVHVHLARTPRGQLLVSGDDRILRYTPNGQLDRGFASGGILAVESAEGEPFELTGLAVDAEERIVAVGDSGSPGRVAILRFRADGTPDPDFGSGDGAVLTDFGIPPLPSPGFCSSCPSLQATGVAIDSTDRIVVGGSAMRSRFYCAEVAGYVGRLDSSGALDSSFGDGGSAVYEIESVHSADGLVLDSSGGALSYGWNGYCHGDASRPRILVNRLDSDGGPNPAFGSQGQAPVSDFPRQIALDGAGRVVVLEQKALQRLLPDGTIDRSFGRGGRVTIPVPGHWGGLTGLEVASGNGLIVTGHSTRYLKSRKEPVRRLVLARVGKKGTLDMRLGRRGLVRAAFGRASNALGRDLVLDSRGRAVVAGMVRSQTLPTGEGLALYRFDLRR